MSNSVIFKTVPKVTVTEKNPKAGLPIRYNAHAELEFPKGTYVSNSVEVSHMDETTVTIRFNVSKTSDAGSTTMKFLKEFEEQCMKGKHITIVVYDGKKELGRGGGDHLEDCEETGRPIPMTQE